MAALIFLLFCLQRFEKSLNFASMNYQQLNLPPYDAVLSEREGRMMIMDAQRRKFVALTPEEWVRQHFVNFLITHLGYPKGLIVNETELRVGDKRLRCDSVLYTKTMRPQMIIEYKAPHIQIQQKTFDQIAVYNLLLHADYLVVSNGLQHYCCQMDYERHTYRFLTQIPFYASLVKSEE